jgi:hypothetical protein
VDCTAAHVKDISKRNARAAMKTSKRVGVRFGLIGRTVVLFAAGIVLFRRGMVS